MVEYAARKGLSHRRLTGAIQVVASAAGYGLLGIFGKRAYGAGLHPGELLALRFLLASAILWLYVLIARRSTLRMSWRQTLACAALGALGYAVFTTLYFHALEVLPASLTVLLLYTYPVIVTLGAHWLFRERVTWAQVVALPVVCAGLVMLLWGGEVWYVKGPAIVLALLTAVFYAAYILASSRLLRSVNPLAAGLYIMTAAAAAFVLWSPPTLERITHLSGDAWVSIIALALVSTVGAMILFLSGLEKLTSTETSLLSAFEPVTATVAAALVLHESLSVWQVAGGALIIGALIFSTLGRRAVSSASLQ